MSTAQFEYWNPEQGERRLRVFISYRYEGDQQLYEGVLSILAEKSGFPVQDISLPASQILKGPRGGKLSRLKVQSEIAARIYTSDIFIAPSRPAATRNKWVTWEVQLAAIGYGIPILFVNDRNDQKYKATLVRQIDDLGLPYRACNPNAAEIARNVADLVSPRPDWTMRREEETRTIRFRGPPREALDDVLRKLPLTSRFPPPEDLPRPQRRSFWPF
ncbi:MAG: hypothetical protein GC206_12395 [Alphaproteobacteria bacterium]|nr:hypothetical protein [Alphaproteobacteria bacterium]